MNPTPHFEANEGTRIQGPQGIYCATLIIWKLNVRAMDTVAPSSSERLNCP